MPRNGNEVRLAQKGLLAILAVAVWAIAQSAHSRGPVDPATLEPLPSDPAKRVYYGEHYSPERYAECLKLYAKHDLDPRVDPCTAYREKLEPLDPGASGGVWRVLRSGEVPPVPQDG